MKKLLGGGNGMILKTISFSQLNSKQTTTLEIKFTTAMEGGLTDSYLPTMDSALLITNTTQSNFKCG